MNEISSRLATAAVLCGVLFVGGCKKSPAPAPAAPVQNADGSVSNPNGTVTVPAGSAPAQAQPPAQPMAIRNSDGSITNPDGSVTYPAGSSVADRENNPNGAASAPTGVNSAPQSAVAGVQSPAEPARLTVPAGTAVVVRLNGGLAASRNEVGDHWSGVLDRALVFHGSTVFAAGSAVGGEVIASKGKGRFKGAGDLGIELTSIGRDHVESSEYEKVGKGRGKRTAGFIGGGGGLGALIGGIAGGGKGALIGGLAGAGAGTAAGAYTGGRDVVIPAESVITFRLRSSLTR